MTEIAQRHAGQQTNPPEEAIRDILTSRDSNRALAQKWGFNRNLPSLVRLGKRHSDIAPDLPRRDTTASSCANCVHWLRRTSDCGLGIPESATEGSRFARWCPTFTRHPSVQ